MSRWIFAVQVRLVCLIDIGYVLFCCQTVSRLEGCCTESAEMAIWGGKRGGIFFPCSAHSEYRMILSCKAASLLSLQFCKSIRTYFNLVNHLSPFFLYGITPYHAFFLCFALPGFICSKQWEFPPVHLENYYDFCCKFPLTWYLHFSFNFTLLVLRHEVMLISIYGLHFHCLPEI